MQGRGLLREGKVCGTPPPTPAVGTDHTGDMLDWKILKLLPSAAVMSLGQRGIDAGYLNALVVFFVFFDRNFKIVL